MATVTELPTATATGTGLDAAERSAREGGPVQCPSAITLMVTGEPVAVCLLNALEPAVAVAARVDGVQIAVVRLPDGSVYAVDHKDPRTGSCTMARGIVGSKNGEPTLAAPLYKEVYSLVSGRCLTNPEFDLVTHPVEVRDGRVFVTARRREATAAA
ncbi:nitrite reductase small subunit NirD [Kocuria sp.]|uniref:nitrite reductase small subunit NirD n=1 Tax=Kocuria sp. TaxID=1871328 RepID=UPI0026DEC562|nr:nitrite reductase small subunit NirD [Kocuria sp.]MDO5619100.1 nitrite reductase small subunit NirD [Kocuria sp.]